MFKPDTTGIKFGPFWIKPGLSRLNTATVVVGSFSTVSLIVFMSLMQPYILNEIVKIPAELQGTVTGRLTLLQEIVTIILVGLAGAWSDQVGRRLVYVCGFIALAAGYLVYPLAGTEPQLVLYRMLFAVGAALAPVMLSVTIQDTPQEQSRGKWVGFNNIFQGLGVVLLSTVLLSNAPKLFVSLGYDAVWAGRLTFWLATAACLLAAVVMWLGLDRRVPPRSPDKVGLFAQTLDGLKQGTRNSRLALAFGAAFIGRGDFVVVGSYLTLWVTQTGIERGMTTAEAVGKAAMTFGMVQLAAIASAFFIGIMADRINRVTGLCIALTMACVGYTAMGVWADPFESSIIGFAILLGMGEIGVIVTAAALLGQEAGTRKRGAIVGAFNLIGGIGIMTIGFAGGLIYDGIGRSAPFTVMGILNGTLLLVGLIVRSRARETVVATNSNE